MAAPTVRSFADLPVDCLLSRVRCREDRRRAYLALACLGLLKLLKPRQPTKLPPALPSLLLPATGPDYSARVVCVTCHYGLHSFPNISLHGVRCFGSHDGRWIFIHSRQSGNQLLNVRTGATRKLPDDIILPRERLPAKMMVRAAALSSSPDDATCVAAAIVTIKRSPVTCVAFWLMGSLNAREVHPPVCGGWLNADDVVYHDGSFYLLIGPDDQIRVYTPPADRQGAGEEWELRHFLPRPSDIIGSLYHYLRSDRYLVLSRGELLLVVRFRRRSDQPTYKFKVFRATKYRSSLIPDGIDFPLAYNWAWSELDTLGGRMLFVGYGCSRSYEADQYPGFEAGIYFLDESMYTHHVYATEYPCRDIGRWSDDDGPIERPFPMANPSANSPPAWLLP